MAKPQLRRLAKLLARFHSSGVRRDHGEVAGDGLAHVLGQKPRGEKVVHRGVEKSLDLAGVEIHGQQPVHAGDLEEVGHELGADGGAWNHFPVLAGVPVVGHHRGDPGSAGAL